MKSKLLKISAFICISIVFSMPGVVHATVLGTADIIHTGYYAFEKVPVWGGGREGTYTHAGVYMLEKSNSTNAGNYWPDGEITGFCMELAQINPTTLSSYDVIKLLIALIHIYCQHIVFAVLPLCIMAATIKLAIGGRNNKRSI